jgi:hypothetical protein
MADVIDGRTPWQGGSELGALPVPNGDALWLIVAFLLLVGSYLMIRPKLGKKKDPLENAPRSSLAQQRSVERQMQNLLVELSEMSRQISAQLDTRAAKLEVLIREADEKIRQLKSLQGAPTARPEDRFRMDEPADDRLDPPDPPDPRYTEVYALADQGRSPFEIAQKLNRPAGEIELILALRTRH